MLKRFANVLVFLSVLWTGFLVFMDTQSTAGFGLTLFYGVPFVVVALCFLYIVRGMHAQY